MRKVIKKIIKTILYWSGITWLIGKFNTRKVFCVGYHSIWDEKNKEDFSQYLYKNISVNVLDFEKQLLFLRKNGHTFVHFSDLKKLETKRLNKPTVIFFDDGFKDVYINALPVLKKYNIPATIFITTGLIDRTDFLWTLSVHHFLSKQGVGNEGIEKKIKELKKFSMSDREESIKKMFSTGDFILDPQSFNVFLNWEEVKILSQNDFEIGSHGVKHQKFTELPFDDLKVNLEKSKNILEEKINKRVGVLSYPYGRYGDQVIDYTISTGYTMAISTINGGNSFKYISRHPFKVKRINPEEDASFQDFKVRLYTNI